MSTVLTVEKQGIKELKESVEAIMEISLRFASVLKDGYQASDLSVLFELFSKDEILKKKIHEAYEGITKVGGEIKDLDTKESIELAVVLLQFIPQILDLFKKDK